MRLASLLAVVVCTQAAPVTVTLNKCFDLDSGSSRSSASATNPTCAGTEMFFGPGTPFPDIIVQSPSAGQTLCIWKGSATNLASLPDVLPDSSQCTNGDTTNPSTGWTKMLTSGTMSPIGSVGIYVKDPTVPGRGWKVWADIKAKTQTSTIEYQLLQPPAPNTPTATATATQSLTLTETMAVPETAAPTDVPTAVPTATPTDAPTAAPQVATTAVPDVTDVPTPVPPVVLCASAHWSTIELQLDRNGSNVLMTMRGPATTWFGVGYGAEMNGSWTVTYAPSGMQEYVLGDHLLGTKKSTVGWDAVEFGGRVQLRKLMTMDTPYYTFPETGEIEIIMACGGCVQGEVSTVVSYHTSKNEYIGTAAWEPCTTPAPPTLEPTPVPHTPEPAPVTVTPVVEDGGGGSSIYMIIGIVLGVVVLLCLLVAFVCLRCCRKTGPTQKKREDPMSGMEEPMLQVGDEGSEGSGVDDVQGLTPRAQSLISESSTAGGSEGRRTEASEALSELDGASEDDGGRDSAPEDSVPLPTPPSFRDEPLNYYEDPELQLLRHQLKQNTHQIALSRHANESLNLKLEALTTAVDERRVKKSLPVPQRPQFRPPPPTNEHKEMEREREKGQDPIEIDMDDL